MRQTLLSASATAALVGLALIGCGSTASSNSAPEGQRPAAAPTAAPEAPSIGKYNEIWPHAVQNYMYLFYNGDLEPVFDKFTDEMKESVPLEQLRKMREQMLETFGIEVAVVGEDSQIKGDYRGYVRWARFDKSDGIIEIQWILRDDDRIAGFFLRERPDPGIRPPD